MAFTHTVLMRCKPPNACHSNGYAVAMTNGNAGNKSNGDAIGVGECHDQECHNHEEEALLEMARIGKTFEATLRGFLVILALSLHALFEGIALGLATSNRSVWLIFFAIASHK